MTVKFAVSLCAVLFVLALSGSASAQATTSDVYQATISWTGAFQDDVSGAPKITKLKITNKQVINLARGRDQAATVPTNEVLAATIQDGGLHRLIVFDTGTSSNLATIATVFDGELASDQKSVTFAAAATVETAGNSTNGFDGGWLAVAGTAKLTRVIVGSDTNYVPASVKGSVEGVLDVIITSVDPDGGTNRTDNVSAIVSKGTLSTKSKIGTLVE